jgi:hypothetical protein
MLEIKKVYIDTRFKTDGNSDSDFYIELPLTLNIPDKCVCYIDDIVLPVSWHMIDSRNNKLYIAYRINDVVSEQTVTIPTGNYNGITFSNALKSAMNSILNPFNTPVEITYDTINNKMLISLTDERAIKTGILEVIILSNQDIETLLSISQNRIFSVNNVLMLKNISTVIYVAIPKTFYLDMFTTRNLYLISSALGSNSTISNFNCDVSIKKIPIRYGYNEMLFDSSEAGYDYLDLSKRTLKRIDFKLQDAFGNIINLNGNHFSFSLVFQEQG